jgi:hypothetical protein
LSFRTRFRLALFLAIAAAIAWPKVGGAGSAPVVDKVLIGPKGSITVNGRVSSRAELAREAAGVLKAHGEVQVARRDSREAESDEETATMELLIKSRVKLRLFTDPTFRNPVPALGSPGTTFGNLVNEIGLDVRLPPYWQLEDVIADAKSGDAAITVTAAGPTGEAVTLERHRAKGRSLRQFLREHLNGTRSSPVSIRPFKICHGTQDALYANYDLPQKSRHGLDLTGMTIASKKGEVVMAAEYAHIRSTPVNADVVAGLENICWVPKRKLTAPIRSAADG